MALLLSDAVQRLSCFKLCTGRLLVCVCVRVCVCVCVCVLVWCGGCVVLARTGRLSAPVAGLSRIQEMRCVCVCVCVCVRVCVCVCVRERERERERERGVWCYIYTCG